MFPYCLLRKALQNTGSYISEIAELSFSGLDDTLTACSERLNVSSFLRICISQQKTVRILGRKHQAAANIIKQLQKRQSFESCRFQQRHIRESVLLGHCNPYQIELGKHDLNQGRCLIQREFWQKHELSKEAESRHHSSYSPHHVSPKKTEKEFYSWCVLCHPTLCTITSKIKEANSKTQPQLVHLLPFRAPIHIVETTLTDI